MTMAIQHITLGGGCFWCLEAVYELVDGVTEVESGYCNGHVRQPSYEQVCQGDTGHVEVVRVSFDDARISLREVLEVFYAIHDPTTLNRQGNDVGSQYRSAIYWADDRQRQIAEASRDMFQQALDAAGAGPITTEIAQAGPFYYAEGYHQQYLHKNPGGYCGLGGTGVSCPVGIAELA
jgi:peptide-methionine (S)-S-oxide reductase